jgi:hypothetical protein
MLDLGAFPRNFFYQLERELDDYFAGKGKSKNIRDFFADYSDQMLTDLRQQLWVMLRDMSNISKQQMRKAAEPILRGFTHLADNLEKDVIYELKSKADFVTIKNRIKGRTGVAEHIARTLTDTGQSAMNNVKIMNDYLEAGFTQFTYSGPPAERRFCVEHLDRTYHIDEIIKMDNGTGKKGKTELAVLFYLGGYNCKHFWQPVWGQQKEK